jgi:hypothetical protein
MATKFSSNVVASESKVAPNTDSDNPKADARVDEKGYIHLTRARKPMKSFAK